MKKIVLLGFLMLSLLNCKRENTEVLGQDSVYYLSSDWENQDGDHMQLASLRGKVVAMVMIYTSCKTACPRLTAEMREISQKTGNVNNDDIRFVLVSIDPDTDTPDTMKAYLKANRFNGKEWMFIRSNEENTRELANALAVKYKKITPMEFSHSNIISIFSRNGSLAFQKEGLNIDVNETVNEIKKQIN